MSVKTYSKRQAIGAFSESVIAADSPVRATPLYCLISYLLTDGLPPIRIIATKEEKAPMN